MSSHPKNVRVEILGEDSRGQAQQFIWRVLQKLGFNSRLFHKTSAPAGKGMGIKFVEDEFPKLLADHRKLFIKSKSVRLIVCCDADKKTTADRRQGLIQAVEQASLLKVASQEGVAILIAKYHIETWLEYLEGHEANEEDEYKHREGKEGGGPPSGLTFRWVLHEPEIDAAGYTALDPSRCRGDQQRIAPRFLKRVKTALP